MTVRRATPTTLRAEGRNYAVLPTDSIDLIQSGDALAIWAYLQSKSSDWTVRKGHIIERLNLSRRRYAEAMKHLHAVGLVEAEASQNEAGRLTGKVLICYDSPKVPPVVTSVSPKVPVSVHTVSANVGESVALPIKERTTNNELIPTGRKREKPQTTVVFKQQGTPPPPGPSPAERILEQRRQAAEAPA